MCSHRAIGFTAGRSSPTGGTEEAEADRNDGRLQKALANPRLL